MTRRSLSAALHALDRSGLAPWDPVYLEVERWIIAERVRVEREERRSLGVSRRHR